MELKEERDEAKSEETNRQERTFRHLSTMGSPICKVTQRGEPRRTWRARYAPRECCPVPAMRADTNQDLGSRERKGLPSSGRGREGSAS